MIQMKDNVLLTFQVLWEEWECDSTAWVMERADGTRYLKMTNHGVAYEAKPEELSERIKVYESVLKKSLEAMELLPTSSSDIETNESK